MKTDTRKELIDLVGVVAIVASLIFLALEIRQSNLATLIATRDSAAQGHMDYLATGIDPSVLATAVAKVYSDLDGEPTVLELSQIRTLLRMRWRHYDRLHYLYRSGAFSESEWAGYRTALANSMSDPINEAVWLKFKNGLSPDFVAYVDALAQ